MLEHLFVYIIRVLGRVASAMFVWLLKYLGENKARLVAQSLVSGVQAGLAKLLGVLPNRISEPLLLKVVPAAALGWLYSGFGRGGTTYLQMVLPAIVITYVTVPIYVLILRGIKKYCSDEMERRADTPSGLGLLVAAVWLTGLTPALFMFCVAGILSGVSILGAGSVFLHVFLIFVIFGVIAGGILWLAVYAMDRKLLTQILIFAAMIAAAFGFQHALKGVKLPVVPYEGYKEIAPFKPVYWYLLEDADAK